MELLKLAESYKDTAKKILLSKQHLQPLVFIITEKEELVCPVEYENDSHKDRVYDAICQLARSKNALGVISISEAWMSKPAVSYLKAPDKFVRPSEAEDKQECVILTAVSRNVSYGWIIPFERKDDEISFGEEIATGGGLTMQDNLIGGIFRFDA